MSNSKYRAYIYPSPVVNKGMVNPYIKLFVEALDDHIDFVNSHKTSNSKGLFDILRYIGKLDIVFFNWPEEVPERKGGLLQSAFYIVLIFVLRIRRVTIFWTFHNKESHVKNHRTLKRFLRKLTARNSDFILTHASEGVSIAKLLAKPATPNIRFIHHPIPPPIEINLNTKKKYDILIWGMITSYKGVEQFLEFLKKENLNYIKILIAGQIIDIDLRDKVFAYESDQVTIINKFITKEELELFITQSRAVLFTYLEYSILSSGALMDTLRYAPLIIGPDFGAFKDLEKEGLIVTYRNYEHLKVILQGGIFEKANTEKIYNFINNNTWADFGNKVIDFISP